MAFKSARQRRYVMSRYGIKAYRGKKPLGWYRDDEGRRLEFNDKQEAQTTANIESTQMEAEGLELKPAKLKKK